MPLPELIAEATDDLRTLYDDAETDLGRDLTDDERDSIADEFLAGLDDEEATMNREAVIESLATNCDCFAKNADVLELLDDEQLAEIADAQEVVNAVREAAPTLTVNAMPAAIKKKMACDDPEEPDEDDPATPPKKKAPMSTQNADEWLRAAPPEVRTVLNHAESILNREKSAIVDRLVANVAAEKRPTHIEKLMRRDLSDLQDELERMPESQSAPATNGYVGQFAGNPASYVGAAAPALNRAGPKDFDENESDESGRPVWNWEEVKKEHRKRD